jgi:hypothetical protein
MSSVRCIFKPKNNYSKLKGLQKMLSGGFETGRHNISAPEAFFSIRILGGLCYFEYLLLLTLCHQNLVHLNYNIVIVIILF